MAKDLPVVLRLAWRHYGVTPVKDQGECGACWAFAALGVIESFVKIYYGQDLDLSEEQIIACNPYGGGLRRRLGGRGLLGRARTTARCTRTAALHGLRGPPTPCTQAAAPPFARLTGWRYIANDVTQIKTAVLTGPVASAMDGAGDFDLLQRRLLRRRHPLDEPPGA